MHYSSILAPVVALVAWTLIVMFWMLAALDKFLENAKAHAK